MRDGGLRHGAAHDAGTDGAGVVAGGAQQAAQRQAVQSEGSQDLLALVRFDVREQALQRARRLRMVRRSLLEAPECMRPAVGQRDARPLSRAGALPMYGPAETLAPPPAKQGR